MMPQNPTNSLSILLPRTISVIREGPIWLSLSKMLLACTHLFFCVKSRECTLLFAYVLAEFFIFILLLTRLILRPSPGSTDSPLRLRPTTHPHQIERRSAGSSRTCTHTFPRLPNVPSLLPHTLGMHPSSVSRTCTHARTRTHC